MAWGGRREGAGRKPGTVSERTRTSREVAERAIAGMAAGNRSPLEVILARMNNPQSVSREQFEAAVAAAPFVHARKAAIAVAEVDPHAQLTPEQIDRRLAELLGNRPPLIETGAETWADGASDAQSGVQSQDNADHSPRSPLRRRRERYLS